MNQTAIGRYIVKKRREKNLTQEQLAEKLGVSNKTISKWENGKCMPDYGIIEQLCKELSVTLSELMDGEDAAEDSVRVYDDDQILDLLRRTQELERQKGILCGFVLIVLGIANGCAGVYIRSSDGAVCCGNFSGYLHDRKKRPETISQKRHTACSCYEWAMCLSSIPMRLQVPEAVRVWSLSCFAALPN